MNLTQNAEIKKRQKHKRRFWKEFIKAEKKLKIKAQ